MWQAKLEDRDVADRDPEAIKQDIDVARDKLAATVDNLAARANPRRLADDLKLRLVAFVKKPAVTVTLAGAGALVVVVMVYRSRNR
jgi:Protein of unknown function (DUF3618)